MAAYYTKGGVNYDTATGQPLNTTMFGGGSTLSGSGSTMGNLFNVGSSYLLGQEGQDAFSTLGQEAVAGAERLGTQAVEGSQFKPFTVTSSLANVGTTPEGGFNLNLSPEQQALQSQLLGGAGALAGNLGGSFDPQVGQIGSQAYGQAGQQLAQVGSIDPSIAAQRGAIGGLFGQQLGQYGQPTGLEGLTQIGLTGAQAQLGNAGQPADINQLRGQFAGQVEGLLGQQPSALIGKLGQQALNLGRQGLNTLEAPSDIEALRAQYSALAGAAGEGLLTSPEERQSDFYDMIRATQRPDEERERLRMEEELFAGGRGGISTAQYGGTPEQFAFAKAQAEAGNTAALQAQQMAMAEQQQNLATATGLTGLASGLAGTSSGLQSEAQARASQLSQLGLSAEQIESQLQSEGLSRGVTASSAAGSLAGIASDLETAGISRGGALANIGLAGQQAGDQVTQQQLQNILALQSADQGAAGLQQNLQQGRLSLGSGLFGLGTQAAQLPSQLQGLDLSNLSAMIQSGYLPQNQALSMLGMGADISNLVGIGDRAGTSLQAQLGQTGLEGYLQAAELGQNEKLASLQSMANTVGGTGGASGLLGGLDQFLPDWLQNLVGDSGGGAFDASFGGATPAQIAAALLANPSMTPAQIAQQYPA